MTDSPAEARDRTTPDDALPQLAQEPPSAEATGELALHYFSEPGRLIATLAGAAGVHDADIDDIVQDFFPVFRAAACRYARLRLAGRTTCALQTFLGKAAVDFTTSAVRRLYRRRRRDARALRVLHEAAAATEATAAPEWFSPAGDPDGRPGSPTSGA